MKNITIIPMTSAWQLSLLALDCATSALATLEVQGFDVRLTATHPAFAAFEAAGSATGGEPTAVKRDRVNAGIPAYMGNRDAIVARVPGSPAWSPPN
ncbi:hypothetical protein ASE01_16690 [Nocardioides sp. Root190]|uniref:hypothetical protein n=1 Tax=Nocardioides sp. Root190 TaxID=1736488 RepID=UPI0006F54462|nr:hypothetical protein [Nocardioides sp. Root190]KRB75005.1 hypothetical protein ASE01_16690 [Nocardioides sp. Root190]